MTANRTLIRSACALLLSASAACSPADLVNNAPLPPDVPDPGTTKTPAGALAAYYGTLTLFNAAFAGRSSGGNTSAVTVSGLLSDELHAKEIGGPPGITDEQMYIDSRTLPEYSSAQLELISSGSGIYRATYSDLQSVRGQANEARGLIRSYSPANLQSLAGHLYAIQGESETLLADLFCSGIPLSTIEFDGDYTLEPGSSSRDIYTHAVAMFDSALSIGADSARFVNLASVGKGRALLALDDYPGAASAVAAVPDGFAYLEQFQGGDVGGHGVLATQNFAYVIPAEGTWDISTSDKEGINGLDFRSSGDPRTTSSDAGTSIRGLPLFHPDKYLASGDSPVVLADWEEARLIEAEAALKAGDLGTWLGKLNHLRETAIFPALPDTTDPGTLDARIDLTFRERAFWLYLTGHRLGDLRRLVRQYGRRQNDVFPVGPYRGVHGSFGGDVTLPIPAQEREANPKFTGCSGRGA